MSPLPQSIAAWNAIFDRYDDQTIETAVKRLIAMCRENASEDALAIAGDLTVRLSVSRRLGFKRWTTETDPSHQ